tara:strand:+ start:225 stop:1337 length:1113 start_codon:yes stop_codon:yes gene_type:complete
MTAPQLRRWTPKGAAKPVRIYVNGLTCTDQGEKVWIENARAGMSLKRRLASGKVRADQTLLAEILDDLAAESLISDANATFSEVEAITLTHKPAARRPRKSPRATSLDTIVRKQAEPGSTWRHPQADALDLASIPLKGPVEILIDHREPALLVSMLQENPMVQVSIGALSLGDIAINRSETASDESVDPSDYAVLVERKDCTTSPTDFEASIINDDKRFFHQTEGLKLAKALGVLILEGDVYSNSTRMDLIQQIDGALSFASAIQRMSVLPTLSLRHTAYVILKLAQHQRYGLGYDLGLRAEKPKAALDRSAYVLEGIPGVNAGLARNLLEHFGSVAGVCAAGIADLKSVPGIGPKRAADIHSTLTGADW